MKLQTALLGLLASLPGVAGTAGFAAAAVSHPRPLLKVHEERTFVPTTPVTTSFHFDDDLLIAQDGSYVYEEVERQFLSDSFLPPQATVAQGTAPAVRLASLLQALAATHIGILGDAEGRLVCRLALRPDEGYVVSWYGRTSRAIRVTVTPEAGAPDCPPEVGLVLQAAQAFKEAILVERGAPAP